MEKTCSQCRKRKPREEFHKRNSSPDGLQSNCKDCRRALPPRRTPALKGSLRPYRENWAEGGRRCTRCQEWKIWAEFTLNSSGHNGRNARCRACLKDIRDGHVARTRTTAPPRLTTAQYERLIREQGGTCAICRAKPPRLVADHDPAGRLRQLLCDRCHAVAQAIQTPGLLDDVQAYLQVHQEVGETDDGDRHRRGATPARGQGQPHPEAVPG